MHFLSTTTTAACAALLLAASALAQGSLYSKKSPVLQVDAKNWDKLITHARKPSVVEFYAPWCGHCQNLKPAYEKAASSLEGIVQVAAVNCDEDANKALCGQMGVKGFPTVKTVRVTGTKGKPIIMEYRGERTAKAIAEVGKGLLANLVKRVEDKELDEWLKEENATAKAILFSDKGKTPALLKSLAIDFQSNLNVAQVRDTQETAVSMFGVSDFPALVVLPGGEASPVIYKGKMEWQPMLDFLKQYAELAPTEAPAKASKKDKGSKAKESKASKSYNSAASSHANAEASEAARSAASETIVDPDMETESPVPVAEKAQQPVKLPDVPTPLPTLASQPELMSACLSPKTSTCVLLILPPTEEHIDIPEAAAQAAANLAELNQKYHINNAHMFPFYIVPAVNNGAMQLKTALGLHGSNQPELVAINGKRSWWRHYDAEKGFDLQSIEDWIDDMKLGNGKKETLPSVLLEGAAEEPELDAERPVVGNHEKHDEL